MSMIFSALNDLADDAQDELSKADWHTIQVKVPAGYALTGEFRPAKQGELYVCDQDAINECFSQTLNAYPIVKLANVYGQDLEGVEIPEGFELDGDSIEEAYRQPLKGEWYVQHNGKALYSPAFQSVKHLIVRELGPKLKRVLVMEIDLPEGREINSVLEAANHIYLERPIRDAEYYIVYREA